MTCCRVVNHKPKEAGFSCKGPLMPNQRGATTMLERNLIDETARVFALPISRRKAFKYVASGFAAALLSFLWPKRAMATDYDPLCTANNCLGCVGAVCWGKHVDDPCTIGGKPGHCATKIKCSSGKCCTCVPGPAPDAPEIGSIPDVTITREASLASGNCWEGTAFVASWFPGRHSVSAREAAATAIARGKPRLARYIAHTAHQVHRGAQV